MNLEHWYHVAEIVSSIAVVVSLCFLALELRLYLRQARQDSIDLITSRRHDLLRVLADDGELSDIVWKGLAGTPRLPADEWSRFGFYMYCVILELERAWLRGKAGVLDKQVSRFRMMPSPGGSSTLGWGRGGAGIIRVSMPVLRLI